MIQLESMSFDVTELLEETLLYFSAMAESCGIRLLSFIDPISTDGMEKHKQHKINKITLRSNKKLNKLITESK
jgi:hypothetical protein